MIPVCHICHRAVEPRQSLAGGWICPVSKRLREQTLLVVVSILLALAQLRMITLVFGSDYDLSINAAKGVVLGLPHWVIYQNRVLGPYTVEVLSRLFNDFALAHGLFTILTTAITGYLILLLARRRFGNEAAWGAFFLFHLQFSMLLNRPWLYTWDHYGIIIFVLFVYFVFCAKDWRWFCALFLVAIFNRESAFYIALWMVLDPLVKLFIDRRRKGTHLNRMMFTVGLGCIAFGLGLVHFLRAHLLVREVGSEIFNLPNLAGQSFHIQLDENAAFLRQALTHFSYSFEILMPVFLAMVVAMALVLAFRNPHRYLALAITQLAMVASVMMLALLREPRAMLELVPFVTLGIWEMNSHGGSDKP